MQTRKSDMDAKEDTKANANADTEASGICTKSNMSPSPQTGGHNYLTFKQIQFDSGRVNFNLATIKFKKADVKLYIAV